MLYRKLMLISSKLFRKLKLFCSMQNSRVRRANQD
jgi:hypothetical protein